MEKRVNSKIENEEREGVRERCEKNNIVVGDIIVYRKYHSILHHHISRV